MPSHLTRLVLVVMLPLVAALSALSLPTDASASGTFTQFLCANPRTGEGVAADGRFPSGAAGWTNRLGVGVDEPSVRCAPGPIGAQGGIPLAVGLPFSTHLPSDATGGFTYTPAAGTELTHVELWRSGSLAAVEHMGLAIHGGEPVATYALPRGDLCQWQDCGGVGDPSVPFAAANRVEWSNPPASGFHVAIGCLIPDASWTCQSTTPTTVMRVFGGRLTLADDVDPEIAGTPTGSLVTDPVLRGDAVLQGHFTDVGAGVYRLVLRLDGAVARTVVADDNGHRCEDADPAAGNAYEFATRQPCKASVNGLYAFSTVGLPEGRHQLRLTVEDAAGNSALIADRAVTVDNVPPPALVDPPVVAGVARIDAGLAGDPGDWTGAGVTFTYAWQRCGLTGDGCADIPGATSRTYVVGAADAGHRLRLRVVAGNVEGVTEGFSTLTDAVPAPPPVTPPAVTPPAVTPPPVTPPADQPTAPPAGTGDTPPPAAPAPVALRLVASTAGRRSAATLPFGRGVTLVGRLTRAGDAPARGDVVTVTERERYGAPGFVPVAQIVTDHDGRFRYDAPGGASRIIRFAYAAGTSAALQAEVTLRVRAGLRMRMRSAPLRNGQTLRWSGRALGRHPGGRLVEIQVRVGHRWQIACAARTSRTGLYHCRHRFRRTFVTTRYRFRARVRSQAGFPYLAAASASRAIVVRP